MIFPEALAQHGLSNATLRRIFESGPPKGSGRRESAKKRRRRDLEDADFDPIVSHLEKLPENPTDWDRRCYFETVIQGEIMQGMRRCERDFNRWGAMDLAHASIPIHPLTLPLMQVAMGHITMDSCAETIGGISDDWKKKLFIRDARNKSVKGVRTPKLLEVTHNLVHSLITRRVAAIATELYQQHPILKFDPYSNEQTERLRGDVMTQLSEQMAGAYGYRHDYEESIRHASLYSDCIKFKANAWDVEKQLVPVPASKDGAAASGKKEKTRFEEKIIREGVLFKIPHPTRRYYDISRPLSKMNHGLGPRWGGHWEAVTLGEIRHNPDYFNRSAIVQDASVGSLFSDNPAYFSQYYRSINCADQPELALASQKATGISASAMSLENQREALIGAWSELNDDTATVLHQHYKQVIPANVGLGTYKNPVWLRFVVAGMKTVVYAEIVGSDPWSVNSYNATDSLVTNPSFGLQAIQWQQMLTNQLNELQHVQAQGLVRIWCLNTNKMKKSEVDLVVNALKDPDFEELKDIVIEYDAEKLAQIGQDPKTVHTRITQVRVETATKVQEIFQNIMNTLALAERQMFFSPQELGQVSARTTSATEQRSIRDTTLGIRDFHLQGVKLQMQADKRIIHSSYMAFGSEELEVPVAERYEAAVIKKAGFEIVGAENPPDGLYTIRGKKLGLLFNYTYTTRHTDDTPPDAAVAQGIAQIYDIVQKSTLAQHLTLDQQLELANSLFDKIAPGIFKMRLPPGVDGKKSPVNEVQAMQQQLQQILPQLGKMIEQVVKKQTEQDGMIAQNDASIKALTQAITKLGVASAKAAGANGAPTASTPRGRVAPGAPMGAGAPPLRGVPTARPVPLIG